MSNIAPSQPFDQTQSPGEKSKAAKPEGEVDQVCHGSLPLLWWRGDHLIRCEGDIWKARGRHKIGVKLNDDTMVRIGRGRRPAIVILPWALSASWSAWRVNRINPRAYLTWVLGEIEHIRGQIDHALLLP